MKYILGFLVILFAAPAFAEDECPVDLASFCVVYQNKTQNIVSNDCVLKGMKNVTVLHQGLCNTVPNAQ
jgi:hypothetical protein